MIQEATKSSTPIDTETVTGTSTFLLLLESERGSTEAKQYGNSVSRSRKIITLVNFNVFPDRVEVAYIGLKLLREDKVSRCHFVVIS